VAREKVFFPDNFGSKQKIRKRNLNETGLSVKYYFENNNDNRGIKE